MLIESIIIGGAIYSFIKERRVKQDKKSSRMAKKIVPSLSSSNTKKLSIKEQFTEIMSPFKDDSRNKQLQEFSEVQKSDEEKEIEKSIAVSALSLSLALVGFYVYSPFLLLSLGGMIFASKGLYKAGYQSLVKERKIDSNVLEAVVSVGILGTGHLIAASIGFLGYYFSKKILLKTEDSSARKLVNLFGNQPQFVWLVKDDIEVEIPFEELIKGSIISIRAGEMIPIDGEIVKGDALINQQALTGESQPAEKGVGASCFATTIVLEGSIHIKVSKAGKDTVAAQIGDILHRTVDYKEVMISKGQEAADQAALPLMLASAASIPFIGITGATVILASTYTYRLGLIAPMTVLNFLTIASKEKVLIKDGRVLELLNKVDTVVFDKTGTLTLPQPYLEKIHSFNGLSEDELLTYTAAAEYRQTHPVALAILQEAKNRKLNLPLIDDAKYEIGYGIQVLLGDKTISVGSAKFMRMEGIAIMETTRILAEDGQQNGYSYIYVAVNRKLEGLLELHPTIRSEAKAIIEELQAKNKTCYIISGDHEQPTSHLAKKLGINNYFAGVLPKDKANLVSALQAENKTVCFIGDGINDAIALKKADVSISIRGASSIATDTAQIILMDDSLEQLPLLFHLGEEFTGYMNKNLDYCERPAIFNIAAALFFNLGISAAIIINQMSLFFGIGNSIHPMLTYRQAKNKKLLKGIESGIDKTETLGVENDIDEAEVLSDFDKTEPLKEVENGLNETEILNEFDKTKSDINIPELELELV